LRGYNVLSLNHSTHTYFRVYIGTGLVYITTILDIITYLYVYIVIYMIQYINSHASTLVMDKEITFIIILYTCIYTHDYLLQSLFLVEIHVHHTLYCEASHQISGMQPSHWSMLWYTWHSNYITITCNAISYNPVLYCKLIKPVSNSINA
jgi:hypothetical protein